MKKRISRLLAPALLAVWALTAACSRGPQATDADCARTAALDCLRARLSALAAEAPAHVGIAVISPAGDTVTVNNDDGYQLMSVFKLHEALAVAHALDVTHTPIDALVGIDRTEMDATTWSPMYMAHPGAHISLPVRELLRYALQESDNNASNLLFDRYVSVAQCDSFVRAATGITGFRLARTEREMHRDHSLADENRSTPLACAQLIAKVFSDSIVSPDKQRALQKMLLECHTGTDRIYAPLAAEQGVTLAHKTGSGFRTPEGLLTAHNDVGLVTLPDGRSYALAVLVKGFRGDEAEAARVIARISAEVYAHFKTGDRSE